MKSIKNQLITLYFISLLIISNTVFAASLFGDDEEIIWQGTTNKYFKYTEQGSSSFGKNDHPVKLAEKEIIDAFSALEFTEKNILQVESIISVFSYSQIKLLAEYLSIGLAKAEPGKDIIFVLGGKASKLIILTEKTFLAGRAFYKEGKLNIILGEYDLVRNAAFEAVLDPGDTGEIAYSFNFGSRTKKSNSFKASVIGVPGVAQKRIKGKQRKDWLEIDIKLAAEAYVAIKKEKENPTINQDKALRVEAAKMARQRREMRAEMARMRKDMQNRSSEPSSAKSIEDRIATLDKLRDKKLITQEEYDLKRKEILNDI